MSDKMSLKYWLNLYENNSDKNDLIHNEFTQLTNSLVFLKNHRDFIEENKLGFGDRAFGFMWYLLLNEFIGKKANFLEIGVFKGQIVSLWSLISKELNLNSTIHGITPLKGNPLPKNKIAKKLLSIFSNKYKKNYEAGNFYENSDYLIIIKNVFKNFNLDFNINIHKGYSNDPLIQKEIDEISFDIIYIDGDHSFEGVLSDIEIYSKKLNLGGYLIMDDASFFLPGTVFWKGHKPVSEAVEKMPSNFANILNVGHNRVYKRIS